MPKKSKASVHLLSYRNHVPKIACFNRAKTPLGVDFDDLIAAMQKYVDDHLGKLVKDEDLSRYIL